MTPKEARRLELTCGLLKAAVFMSCAAGFTYQVVEFALHFWTYPTNINLEIPLPQYYTPPTYTMEHQLTYSDMIELKQNFSAFKKRTYLEHDFTAEQYKRKRPVFFHGSNGVTNHQGCFTENTRFDNKAEPIIKKVRLVSFV
ncbi:hypothetical protein CEXT_466971 [Caerostris extrusa]|uniref:Uncharacterized protein n=1 Tax=Caerostris extrusa TaxID=172846 RepID=A0AAV4U8T2_CAEEX|nr:hypothetical protein CEXT_466971 [Caerostris extrusa]